MRPLPALAALLAILAGCAAPDRGATPLPGDSAVPDALAGVTWSAAKPIPSPRTEVVGAALGNQIFVIGGFLVVDAAPVPTARVDVYDAERDAWSTVPDYPLHIHHSVAVPYQGSLYVLGGLTTAAFQPTQLAFRFDAGTRQWLPIAPLPVPRGAHVAALVEDKIYVAAGRGLQGHLTQVDAYDPRTDRWETLPRAIPTVRDHTSAAAVGGKLYVLGGDVAGHGENTDAAEAFDPATGQWSKIPPVPTLRGSLVAVSWRGQAVVLGGQNAEKTFDAVEAYDPIGGLWSRLPPLTQARHGFVAAVANDVLFAVTGGDSPGVSATASVERLA